MRLHQIRVFLAVVESGSLRAAARSLGVSQPAVSKSLRQLEEELRVHLFERRPHGVVATTAGRAFVARARVVQSELRKAEEEFARFSGDGEGTVAVGAGFTEMALVIPDAVAEFRRQLPRARVRVIEGRRTTLIPLVRDETLDFSVGLGPDSKADTGLDFRPLFRSDYVVAARKGHPLRNERSLAALVDAEWLAWAGLGGIFERAFAVAGIPAPRPPEIECESFNGVVSVLLKTDMLALIGHRTFSLPFARDSLQKIHVAEELPSMSHGMFTRADARPTRAASAMAKIVIGMARRLAGRK